VRTQVEFELRLAAAWNRLVPVATELARLARQTLEAYATVAQRLWADLAPLLAEPIADLRAQLAALMPPTFLSATPYEWLVHFPRYLGAMDVRLTKLTNAGLLREAHHLRLIAPLWDAYVQRRAEHAAAGIHDPELERFRFAIEELRVSLFAQGLKTAMPVSIQRLQRQLSLVRSA
jgi:ATP-dependent helicase HrpA